MRNTFNYRKISFIQYLRLNKKNCLLQIKHNTIKKNKFKNVFRKYNIKNDLYH